MLLFSDQSVTGPINLGNPVEISIFQLAEKIIDYVGSNSKIVKLPLPEDDPKQRKPDISRAIKELKWKPIVELESGLKTTITDFATRLLI
jgi:UDP-glucuronate decarboxylase